MFFLSGMIFIGATLNIMLNYQVIFMQSMNRSDLLIGIAIALPALLEIPMMMITPKLLRTLPMQKILMAGAVILPIRWALFYVIQNPIWILPVQVFNFVSTISFEVVGVSFVDKSIPVRWRASGQGLYTSAMFGIGPGLGNFIAGNVMEAFHVRAIWILNCIAGVVGLVLVFLAVRHFSDPTEMPIGESKNAGND